MRTSPRDPLPGATATPGPSTRFRRSLAVVIGVDHYGDGISPLRSAVADAKAIAEVLGRGHGFETCCLYDDDVRLPRLLTLLRDELPARLGPDDRLLFYFAGHGIALDDDAGPAGYLVPARAARGDRESFLPMQVLHDELARLPVRHAFLILDCCFAGRFRWSSLRDIEHSVAKVYRERYDRYLESAAWQVLTSASSDQHALDALANARGDAVGGHSPFALALLDGLAGAADYTQDHVITADELAMYLRERVAMAAESVGRRQVPQLFPLARHDGGQFVFQVPHRTIALAPAPALDESTNPYRGLQAFREDDRALFFGREALTRQLVDAVVANRLTVVVGPSGSGKSSLVHAGLVPAVRDLGWAVLPAQRPGQDPLTVLDSWADALGAPPGQPATRFATAVAHASAADRPWLAVVDQLEEVLTHRTAPADRAAFLEALAGALAAAPLLRLVVTVRSDTEPLFHDTALRPWWSTARFTVPAMTRDELRQAVEQPATAAVLHFAPSRLVERLIDDVALVPSPLPLLSFALSELYRRCWARWQGGVADRALRETDYEDMGSVGRALTLRATELHDQLVAEDAAYRTTIRNVFTRMVATGGGEIARRRVPRDELDFEDPAENRRVAHVLQRFHEARLLSLGTEPARDGHASPYAEPVHDELVRGWTKVGEWLDELDAIEGTRALLFALHGAVHAWRAHAQADVYLWNDPRVELLQGLAAGDRLVLNAPEARFLQRSAHRRRRRRRRLAAALVLVATALTATAAAALRQREHAADSAVLAQRRRGEGYLEQGRSLLLDGHPMQALPYLVAARAEGIGGRALQLLFAQASRDVPRVTLANHTDEVAAAAFSPDGTRVVTASKDGTARLWNAATGTQTAQLPHRDAVRVAAFSPDGTRVVTAGHDDARIWDVATGKRIARLRPAGDAWAVAFDPEGARVVVVSGSTATVWDAASGMQLLSIQHPRDLEVPDQPLAAGTVEAISSRETLGKVLGSHPDVEAASNISSQEAAGTVPPRTVPTGPTSRTRAELATLPPALFTAAFSPDGRWLVTAGDDGTARIWDAASGRPIARMVGHRGPVWGASGRPIAWMVGRRVAVWGARFSADGRRLVTAGDDGTARIWDAATGAELTGPLQHEGGVLAAAFSPDGTRVVTASSDFAAQVWDAATGARVTPPLRHRAGVEAAAFSPDGTQVVTASLDGSARVWDAATGLPVTGSLEHLRAVTSAAYSADGRRVITASNDGTARIWDATPGGRVAVPAVYPAADHAWFSASGTRIITTQTDHAPGVSVWDARTHERVAELCPIASNRAVAFSPEVMRVVSSNEQSAWICGTATGQRVDLRFRDLMDYLAFSPDGSWIAAAGRNTVHILDGVTGSQIRALVHHDAVHASAFSPDSTRLVTTSADNTARVWDVKTGQLLYPPLEHKDLVTRVAFSHDGTRIATVSWRTVQIWNAATGAPAAPPLEHLDAVGDVAFNRDGTQVVTVTDGARSGGVAQVWDSSAGNPTTPRMEHDGRVFAAAFSPDDALVATGGDDRMVRVWDARTGKPVTAPLAHRGQVRSIGFDPQGMQVLTVSSDFAVKAATKEAKIWTLPVDTCTLSEWQRIARCSPFELREVLRINQELAQTCPVLACAASPPMTPPEPRGLAGG